MLKIGEGNGKAEGTKKADGQRRPPTGQMDIGQVKVERRCLWFERKGQTGVCGAVSARRTSSGSKARRAPGSAQAWVWVWSCQVWVTMSL